ncbi:MAG TPA: hypothetical protein VLR71_22690 [Casimicrobiaceae bacterium]|nr:hypothetical protein [Casimicrobiaceae bacterium]
MQHEPDQPRLTALMLGAGAVLVTVAAAVGVATLISQRPANPAASPAGAVAEAPRLEAAPAQDIVAYRTEKDRLLHGYAWVDRSQGIVRIPIERAMTLLVQQQAAKGTR